MPIPYTFWQDVEKPMNYVLYGDTDSIFINIPLDDDELESTENLIQIANRVSEEINERIKFIVETKFLPGLGVDITHNQTFFKTELVADAVIFLDIKKNYAYRELANKGHINDKIKFKYVGVPVVKSNVSILSKKIIRMLIENVALNIDVTNIDMIRCSKEIRISIWNDMVKAIETGDFIQFATPCKWGSKEYAREPTQITGMRLYNTITKTESFTPNSSGMYFPIHVEGTTLDTKIKHTVRSEFMLPNNITVTGLKFIAVPYGCNGERILKLLKEHQITIDKNDIYDSINSKVSVRIYNTIKKASIINA